jgi:Tat protein secretion system quality control protein TatD with DNase activity
LKKLADIRGFSVAEMADITRRNTQNLFSKMVLS